MDFLVEQYAIDIPQPLGNNFSAEQFVMDLPPQYENNLMVEQCVIDIPPQYENNFQEDQCSVDIQSCENNFPVTVNETIDMTRPVYENICVSDAPQIENNIPVNTIIVPESNISKRVPVSIYVLLVIFSVIFIALYLIQKYYKLIPILQTLVNESQRSIIEIVGLTGMIVCGAVLLICLTFSIKFLCHKIRNK